MAFIRCKVVRRGCAKRFGLLWRGRGSVRDAKLATADRVTGLATASNVYRVSNLLRFNLTFPVALGATKKG